MRIQRIVLDSDTPEAGEAGLLAATDTDVAAARPLTREQEATAGSVLHVVGEDTEFRALEGLQADECDRLIQQLDEFPVETIVLDLCWTPAVGKLLATRVQTVIGIPARIGRTDADQFISTWSDSMATGSTSVDAFERALGTIAAEELPEDLQPVFIQNEAEVLGFRAPRRSSTVKVAFGTNRIAETESGRFTSGTGKTLTGTCEVTVFSAAPVGRHRRSLGRDDTPVLRNHTVLDSRAFTAAMKVALDADTSGRRAVLVYIHGFNTGFREAAQHTAQFHVDLNVPGATVLFSWPSRGSGHQLAYHADEDSIIAAERPLYDFLTTLHDLPDVGPVHVLAHSMGCRAALRAVVRAVDSGMAPFELGELILAAPDVSEKYFAQVAPVLSGVARRTTIYTSRRDRALRVSELLHNAARVGSGKPVARIPEVPDRMTFVDAGNVDISFLGHGYYAASAPVLRDIHWLLYGMPAGSRFGMEHHNDPGRLTLRASH
ncbi:alpha/beta hydrolase [Paenarthrobacter nicotinovorans]|uniref:alpha/beta hydrolase n=1 Tax=Paenarthrobacter nicotinovorans TaxID=29320 RepID=UPI00374914BE